MGDEIREHDVVECGHDHDDDDHVAEMAEHFQLA